MGGAPSFTKLIEGHKSFHIEAGKVAEAINEGQIETALSMIGNGSAFSKLSNEVGRLIVQLKRESARSAS